MDTGARAAFALISPVLRFTKQSSRSPFGRATHFWHCPKVGKRLGAERGVLIRLLRIKIPCASRRGGVAQTVCPCTASQSRRSIAATLRAFPATPAMLGTADGAPCPLIRPSMDCLETNALASARGMRVTWGPCVAASVRRKGRRLARTMRASSLHVHGRAFSEPRSTLAHSQGRMPGERHTGVAFSLVIFLLAKAVSTGRCNTTWWNRLGEPNGHEEVGSAER